MEKRKMNTRYMATLAMFCGVLLVMGVTGIGFIPLPVIKATTMHIPVILGAVLLGPGAGAVKPVDRTGVPDSVRRDCGMAVEAV